MTNKKNKKEKKSINLELKDKITRISEVNEIISKIHELHLNIQYEPIKQLFFILQCYVNDGGIYKINIPFPMINRRIKGLVSDNFNEECEIKLIEEKF